MKDLSAINGVFQLGQGCWIHFFKNKWMTIQLNWQNANKRCSNVPTVKVLNNKNENNPHQRKTFKRVKRLDPFCTDITLLSFPYRRDWRPVEADGSALEPELDRMPPALHRQTLQTHHLQNRPKPSLGTWRIHRQVSCRFYQAPTTIEFWKISPSPDEFG